MDYGKMTKSEMRIEIERLQDQLAQGELSAASKKDQLIYEQHNLSKLLNEGLDFQASLRACLDTSLRVSGMDSGGIYLFDEEKQSLELAIHTGLSEEFIKVSTYYDRNTENVKLVKKRKPLYAKHSTVLKQFNEMRISDEIYSIVIIPLVVNEQIIGCLNIGSGQNQQMPLYVRQAIETISTTISNVILQVENRNRLQENERRFRSAVKCSSDLVYEWDLKSDRLQWFGDLDSMLGYKPGDVAETLQAWIDLVHPDDRDRFLSAIDHHRVSQEEILEEYRVRTKNGKWRYWQNHGVTVLDSDAGIVKKIGVCIDITDRKIAEEEKGELQKQIFHSSKLASIGELAAGVGHEINNPLAIIQGYTEIIRNRYQDEDSGLITLLDLIDKSINRISHVVDGLKTFAPSGDEEDVHAIDIHRSLIATINFIKGIYEKENIFFKTTFSATDPDFLGDKSSFQQAMISLFSNAKDAMNGNGGRIEVETFNKDQFIVIKISDTGIGITKENLDRIFDSFFTTKPTGQGTGLGLGITHSLIKSWDGDIEVESEPGVGSTFIITLPTAESVRSR